LVPLATPPLVRRFGLDFQLPGVNGKLKCLHCGSTQTEGRPDYKIGDMGLGDQ
jgi:hypothetical protein